MKEEIYKNLLPGIEALIAGEEDETANLANVAAALHDSLHFWWTGFYIVKGEEKKELVLGPFQGPVACTRIGYGKGVCGTAWKEKRTVIVEDVRKFPGHIACSSASLSEIVVPLFRENGDVYGVLDIDSEKLSTFDEVDRKYLEKLSFIICKTLK